MNHFCDKISAGASDPPGPQNELEMVPSGDLEIAVWGLALGSLVYFSYIFLYIFLYWRTQTISLIWVLDSEAGVQDTTFELVIKVVNIGS